jgi:hypothetical protein
MATSFNGGRRPVPSQDLDFKWAFSMVLSSEVNSEMLTEVKYQTKFILNTRNEE